MRDQLYRSITPVSTAATIATSSNQDNGSSADSNHTYEPIENAQAMFENIDNDSTDGLHQATPFTLIHHDGRKVTANNIVSLDNLRQEYLFFILRELLGTYLPENNFPEIINMN